MAVRIHFAGDDLAHLRLARAPDPLWEALLSMHMLQTRDAAAVFGGWRQAVRRELTGPMRELLRLGPPTGYSADFLTPAGGSGGLEAGIGALLSTPRRRLRHDLLELSRAGRPLPSWAGPLAAGDKEAVVHLARTVRAYFRIAVAPWWTVIRARLDAELARHDRSLAGGGLGALLRTLHPGLAWEPPVLELGGLGADRDVHLGGQGMLVVPSYFCWRRPTLLRDPALPCVVVYPMTHETVLDAEPGRTRARSLNALVGPTRAEILESVAAQGMTTTELAHDVGIAPGTASHHAGVLRAAGLLHTNRVGRAVLHTPTPLGLAVLYGSTGLPLGYLQDATT